MATLMRMRVTWTGTTGLPGVNTLLFDQASVPDPAPSVRAFFESIKALLAQGVTVSYDNSGDLILDSTGVLGGTWSGTAAASTTSTAAAAYAGPVGACLVLRTNTIIGRRRLMGKMFLVPLSSSAMDTTGRLLSSAVGTINTAAATLLATGAGTAWRVWHRPKAGSGGSSSAITSARTTNLAAVLRSRRD